MDAWASCSNTPKSPPLTFPGPSHEAKSRYRLPFGNTHRAGRPGESKLSRCDSGFAGSDETCIAFLNLRPCQHPDGVATKSPEGTGVESSSNKHSSSDSHQVSVSDIFASSRTHQMRKCLLRLGSPGADCWPVGLYSLPSVPLASGHRLVHPS